MNDNDISAALAEQVRQAAADGRRLRIRGGDTKAFYGRALSPDCEPLEVGPHQGIVAYEPTELALTVRAGTPLAEVEQVLAEQGQQLPFEPPAFGPAATIGGVVAAGLSGPARPWGGSVRDAVLGVKLLNGRGEILEFGGRVMKNVAGYDVSRLMAGSLGTLGVLLEISLKVMPRPRQTLTLVQELEAGRALEKMVEWGRRPLPLTGAAHLQGRLYLRIAGGELAIDAAREVIGGDPMDEGEAFWRDLKEQRLPFFQGDAPLWRLSLPPAAPAVGIAGDCLIDWGGALRWVRSDAPAAQLREAAARLGGHATWFRGHDGRAEVFQPLPPPLMRLHRNVKQALDPQGIFGPGRLYAEL